MLGGSNPGRRTDAYFHFNIIFFYCDSHGLYFCSRNAISPDLTRHPNAEIPPVTVLSHSPIPALMPDKPHSVS